MWQSLHLFKLWSYSWYIHITETSFFSISGKLFKFHAWHCLLQPSCIWKIHLQVSNESYIYLHSFLLHLNSYLVFLHHCSIAKSIFEIIEITYMTFLSACIFGLSNWILSYNLLPFIVEHAQLCTIPIINSIRRLSYLLACLWQTVTIFIPPFSFIESLCQSSVFSALSSSELLAASLTILFWPWRIITENWLKYISNLNALCVREIAAWMLTMMDIVPSVNTR